MPALLSRFSSVDITELGLVAEREGPRMPFSRLGNLILDCFDIITVGTSEPVFFLVHYEEVDYSAMFNLAVRVHAALGEMDAETKHALGIYDAFPIWRR